jgi:hypothetical protein
MEMNKMPMGTITIYEDRYEELLESHKILEKLYEYGVDNWEGYDDAIREFREENKEK